MMGLMDDVMMILLDYAKALSSGTAKHDDEAGLEERMAQVLITGIGKAVLSGKYPQLDRLLGVVGRGRADASSTVTPIKGTCYLEGHIETHDEEFMSRDDTDLVDIPIIALGKEGA